MQQSCLTDNHLEDILNKGTWNIFPEYDKLIYDKRYIKYFYNKQNMELFYYIYIYIF